MRTLVSLHQRQVGNVAFGVFANRQQQALEVRQQTLDRGLIKKAFVVRQVQAQRIAGVHHHGDRVVGVSARAVGLGADLLSAADHRAFHRGVFIDKQAVENRLAFVQRAARLNAQQRQMLVLTQRQVVRKHPLQPLAHADPLPCLRQTHAQRDAVDEQANGVLHFRAIDRAPGYGDAKQHFVEPAVALQHQRPGGLGQGVDGHVVTLGQFAQGAALADLQVGIAITDLREPALTAHGTVKGQRRRLFKPGQFSAPGLQRFTLALGLQPFNKVAIPRRGRQAALAAVQGKEVLQQQRAAPGINQDVVVAEDEPVMPGAATDQAQAEWRRVEQVKTLGPVLGQQRLQRRFVFALGAIRPVVHLHVGRSIAVDDLQHLAVIVKAERSAQRVMTLHHRVPGCGKAWQVDFAVDDVTVLHVVNARAWLEQGVYQQALLHRRQRVDVFDGTGRNFEGVQLRLGQLRQREVRRGHAALLAVDAMGN